jgi:hypothetical protein
MQGMFVRGRFKWKEVLVQSYLVTPPNSISAMQMRLRPSEAASYRLRGYTVERVK